MSKIQWTDMTWNPVTGCSKISPACDNCYAEKMAKRLAGRYGYPKDDPFKITFHEDKLLQPMKINKPKKIFVCSMGDLFHKDVPTHIIDSVFNVMKSCSHHTFQVLTKRPERMQDYIRDKIVIEYNSIAGYWYQDYGHVWLGTTAENQGRYDQRINDLMQSWGIVRFVSFEPLLGYVDMTKWCKLPEWIIIGGETGNKARQMEDPWVKDLIRQARLFEIPVFFKSWGKYVPADELSKEHFHGQEIQEFPITKQNSE